LARGLSVCILSLESVVNPPGGLGIYARDLATTLSQRGVNVYLISKESNRFVSSLIDNDHLRHHAITTFSISPFYAMPYNVAAARTINSLQRKESIDLVHDNLPMPSILFWRKRTTPLVITLHSTVSGEFKSLRSSLSGALVQGETKTLTTSKIQLLFERWGYARSDKLIALSKAMANEVSSRYPSVAQKLEVIPCGVDTQRFSPDLDGLRVRSRLSLQDKKIILYVGRITHRKRLIDAVVALKNVCKTVPNVVMMIVGAKNAYSHQLESLALDWGMKDKILFTGYVPESQIQYFYAACDVFIHVSTYEGLPNSVVRAMSCGKTCIVSSFEGVEELLNDRTTGIVVPVMNPGILAKVISSVLAQDELRKLIGGKARETVVKHFGLDVVADQMISLYEDVTSHRR